MVNCPSTPRYVSLTRVEQATIFGLKLFNLAEPLDKQRRKRNEPDRPRPGGLRRSACERRVVAGASGSR
jgi:hypothetical protein